MSPTPDWDRKFHEDLAADAAAERALIGMELIILTIVVLLLALREALL